MYDRFEFVYRSTSMNWCDINWTTQKGRRISFGQSESKRKKTLLKQNKNNETRLFESVVLFEYFSSDQLRKVKEIVVNDENISKSVISALIPVNSFSKNVFVKSTSINGSTDWPKKNNENVSSPQTLFRII